MWGVSMQESTSIQSPCSAGQNTTTHQAFSFSAEGEEWELPFATMGESTMVTPSSPEPSSEEATPESVVSCLVTRLVVNATVEAALWTILLAPRHILQTIAVIAVGRVARVGDSAMGATTAAAATVSISMWMGGILQSCSPDKLTCSPEDQGDGSTWPCCRWKGSCQQQEYHMRRCCTRWCGTGGALP